ncbi:T9SS type A sorting domain-containing protein [Candidatus Ulvibacter alkanivorans]|uniref:T9SS type A sorting domain-containing protein n=1 Tax=Candidatus Ulvibacter alkanivorans TaxID=2267620 RepID=UPI000DF12ACA|nr:T9SS type A sorting domain-containing protein [Candidatus Ulvibacter alkanivorans]
MKRTLRLLFLLLFFVSISEAQENEDMLLPFSWTHSVEMRTPPIELPPINIEALQAEDQINDRDKSLPWRYGVKRELQIDLLENAIWTILPNGDRLLQVAIYSPNAVNLSLNFDNFFIPKGGRMHLFNETQTDVSRAFTNDQNRSSNVLGSWFITGEVIIVEYYEPAYVSDEVRLSIESVIHGYRMGAVERYAEGMMRGLNDSGSCNYDVNCSVGEDFDTKKDILKKSVALLNLGNGYLCSASLLNNSVGDKTPYLLSGNHCLDNSDPALWSVRFNWMSPNPVCATEEESDDLQTNFTMSGTVLRANNELSDFALVELVNPIPDSWDITFAGWDRTDTDPEYQVGIHHPNGDIMKICRDDDPAVKENAGGTEVWLIGGVSAGNGDGWDLGTTESGSSGSPLFDQNGRIIGQLYAGQAFCDGLDDNDEYDIYGRFAVSWDSGTTPESRLKDWLDPNNSGMAVTEALQNILSTPDINYIGNLEIYPNPATTEIFITNNRYPNLSYRFFNVMGQELKAGSLSNTYNSISLETFVKGVYFLQLTDEDSDEHITKKILVNR